MHMHGAAVACMAPLAADPIKKRDQWSTVAELEGRD